MYEVRHEVCVCAWVCVRVLIPLQSPVGSYLCMDVYMHIIDVKLMVIT